MEKQRDFRLAVPIVDRVETESPLVCFGISAADAGDVQSAAIEAMLNHCDSA